LKLIQKLILKHKLESARQFLTDGDKVKFTVKFRGREITHPQLGEEKLKWLLQELAAVTGSHTPLSLEGKVMSVVINPKNN
jgi:translation initiation factor IF-3